MNRFCGLADAPQPHWEVNARHFDEGVSRGIEAPQQTQQ
jgi:hypothetical protein